MLSSALISLSVLFVGAFATGPQDNQARADETMGFDIPGLPEITVSSPNDVAPVLSAVVANSDKVAAAMGTSSMFALEANLLLNEATQAIATQTRLSAFITTVGGTPVVEVSSVSGSDAVTLATGPGSATILAGQTFTAAVPAAPNKNGARGLAGHNGLQVLAGVATVVGALAVGAAMVAVF
ncbi:hypothetical protein V8D89_012209 [Ganoderma adspersum]